MTIEINKISIIGSGNVATHLAVAFDKNNIEVTHVYSRNELTGKELSKKVNAEFVSRLAALPLGQLTILCVPDDSIQEVINDLPNGIPVAYSSGSVDLKDISTDKEIGVFYPLQTFSKNQNVDIFNVPFLIEARNEEFAATLFNLAWQISRKVEFADSEKRGQLHLAAVWINNFVNHCIHQAHEICTEYDIDYTLLQPLLEETVRKAMENTPKEVQTGPAKRGDQKTIQKHMDMQTGLRKELYKLLTESIQNTYK